MNIGKDSAVYSADDISQECANKITAACRLSHLLLLLGATITSGSTRQEKHAHKSVHYYRYTYI